MQTKSTNISKQTPRLGAGYLLHPESKQPSKYAYWLKVKILNIPYYFTNTKHHKNNGQSLGLLETVSTAVFFYPFTNGRRTAIQDVYSALHR